VGPTPATSKQITDALAKALHRWHPWVVPQLAIGLLGEAGAALLLADQNVAPERLLADGFEFRYQTVDEAINELAREL
jgi:NAD dependent epimerase/dehydratase family enzyme